jgi:AcrR family transcriptional regulator
MPTTEKSPPQKRPGGRSARIRAAVLEATLEELADGGYASFSLESVARRAGVHKTTLYRRWGTRERLLLDAMLERARDVVPVPDTGLLRGDLLELARSVAASLAAPESEAVVRAAAGIGPRDPALMEAVRSFWDERLRLDGAIMERAIARGEARPDADPEPVIEAVLGAVYMRLLVTARPLDDAFLEAVVEAVAGGIAAR